MPDEPARKTSIKETLTSIMIAFIVALVFRGFVVEGFQIPTGSMGPTLLGAHVRVRSDMSGYEWPLEPWARSANNVPERFQPALTPHDPMTGIEMPARDYATLSGDRVFVYKYLEPFHGPQRWDVTVFKVPTGVQENYIKRLIGMPGEQVALVDGDVFTHVGERTPVGWDAPGWVVQRKPERVQRAVFQPVFDARYTPPNSATFRSPFRGATPGWRDINASPTWSFDRAGQTRLEWLNSNFRLDDYLSFNEMPAGGQWWSREDSRSYPVSDVSMGFGFEPQDDGARVGVVLEARGYEFRGTIGPDGAAVEMRPQTEDGSAAWMSVDASARGGLLKGGRITNIEFWHVDQALWLFADGDLVAGGPKSGAYDWSIGTRLSNATGRDILAALAEQPRYPLNNTTLYREPRLSAEFAGPAFRVHNMRVCRDLFYRPENFGRTSWPGDPLTAPGQPGLGTHPNAPMLLGPDDFFLCGDNSARSLDGRLWGGAHPMVVEKVGTGPGRVSRTMLIGRAFFVYFPSPQRRFGLPVLDFGRMRWIW
ncbi:MAG: hypothetical protein KJZ65_11740 [Phycisphaerales bacterium]|nr:hypothetical protein [Phycisphaerales bacterium]